MLSKDKWVVLKLVLLFCVFLFLVKPGQAQNQSAYQPIDLIILIDNSCSMFAKEQVLSGCTDYGSDPDFLRIIGADLFLASLGFGEPNEADYQTGIVSIGNEPQLVSELKPLAANRDVLARSIAQPAPQPATKIVPALVMAYSELRQSPNRRPTNLPTIVLITDGVPWPTQGQNSEDIERLISASPDVPVFIMLLQNVANPNGDYAAYIKFWKQMQSKYSHVFVYQINQAEQIEDTYNRIVAQMQSTIPSVRIVVSPQAPLEFFVNQYVQKIVVKAIHQKDKAKGLVLVTDSQGNPIQDNQPGVSHFKGEENPIEIFSISPPRLNDSLKKSTWKISSSEPVVVFLDRKGAYRINFLAPFVSMTNVTDVYLGSERQNPAQKFNLRFNLLMADAKPVLDTQPIQGKVILPDGQEVDLNLPAAITPDADGTYTLVYDLAAAYPPALEKPGRFTFLLGAGDAAQDIQNRIPIASARLFVDVGRAPFIRDIQPSMLSCEADKTTRLTVSIGDANLAQPDSLQLRVFAAGQEMSLTAEGGDTYSGDLSALCEQELVSLSCSTKLSTSFQLRLSAQSKDGTLLPAVEQEVPVSEAAAACIEASPTATQPSPTATATPLPPTATAAPLPTPTPIPDSDRDGVNDSLDLCPTNVGFDLFNGCPLPWWVWAGGVALLIMVGWFITFLVVPWFVVRISPPPQGYVQVWVPEDSEQSQPPRSLYKAGMSHRTSQIRIGNDRKRVAILVKQLKPVECIVIREGNRTIIKDSDGKRNLGMVGDHITTLPTSNPEVKLRFSLKADELLY